jgi:hypothetical protein
MPTLPRLNGRAIVKAFGRARQNASRVQRSDPRQAESTTTEIIFEV